MTAHDPALQRRDEPVPSHLIAAGKLAHLIAAGKLVRPLLWLGIFTTVAAGGSFTLFRRNGQSWIFTGHPPDFAGLTAGALLLATIGIWSCLCMVLVRRRELTSQRRQPDAAGARKTGDWISTIGTTLLIAAAGYVVLADWPLHQTTTGPLDSANGFTVASALLLLATPWLLAERYIASIAAEQFPERDNLQNLLFLPVVFLGAQAALAVAASLGFGTLYWARAGLSAILLLLCAELSCRVLATWFLPPPDSIAARATIGSFLAGVLRGRSLSPAAMATTVRTQFGMDFSRSWALHFVRVAAAPVALLMLAFCWFLTGVTRIDLNERGSYERFGTVATILKPGLHLVLPWPFGVVRHVEFGVIRSALIGVGDQGVSSEAADQSTAEGDAPPRANRLWDSEQPTDVSYIIASGEQDRASSQQDRQSFQTVSASVRVLYRVGLSDRDARAALYDEADPDALVRSLASRLLAQFFASRTLPSVLGESQRVIADELRTGLQQALEPLISGIEIVAVTIEAIHPPAGAASAYRNVQAAEIEATTSIATERGRAQTTRSVAQRDAHSATDDAAGSAAETVSTARVDLINITADDGPYRAAGKPFLLERYFSDMKSALANIPLEIVDHRLSGASLPTIDLRPPGMLQDGTDRRQNQAEKSP
jgi:regulator of protease activity HflC (stomatin/prohibitin superfamily)